MKMMHLADLHIGKVVNGYSMLEEQTAVLQQVAALLEREQIRHLLLAGDIYDSPQPSQAAVELFDQWINSLRRIGVRLYLISGNHDSMRRLSFGEQSFQKNEIEISPYFTGKLKTVMAEEDGVRVAVTLMPYLKPALVRPYIAETVESYEDAVRLTLAANPPQPDCFNLLVAHQFVTGARTCESEELVIGGSENISGELFAAYDYVALGHLHEGQSVGGRATVRYAGSPLKYSFSEVDHRKSATVLTWTPDGVQIDTIPLVPVHDLAELTGLFAELMERRVPDPEAYMRIVLRDETEIPQALSRLRTVFPNIMRLEYSRSTSAQSELPEFAGQAAPDVLEVFGQLYQRQMGAELTEQQKQLIKELAEEDEQ